MTLDKEINEAIASDQIMSGEKVNSPMDPRVVNSPSDSPSLSDLSETSSKTQREIGQGEAVSAAELFQENERLRNLLAKSERDINIERIRSRDIEIQCRENRREMSPEYLRSRTEERHGGTRTGGQNQRVSFSDFNQSPGRTSEGSRHSVGSRHDGSHYQNSRASTCWDPEAKARRLINSIKETIKDECPRVSELTSSPPELLQFALLKKKKFGRI